MNFNERLQFIEDKKQFIKELYNRNDDLKRCISYCNLYNFNKYKNIKKDIKEKYIKNIYLVGMGSSLYASQYISERLNHFDVLVLSVEASEFKDNYSHLVDEHSLLIIISQSGNSKEIVEVIEKLKEKNINYHLITITNNFNGYLYKNYENSILLNASEEFYISHNSYLNTLLVLNSLFDYLFDKFTTDIDTKTLVDKINNLEMVLYNHKDIFIDILKNICHIDFIYSIYSKHNAINSALLFREGLGLLTGCYSKNEYLHGEHLVDKKNKLICFVGLDKDEDKYKEIMQEIEYEKQILISSSNDTNINISNNMIEIKLDKSIKDLGEMVVFNQFVAWGMEV